MNTAGCPGAVQARQNTPFFTALAKYAARPAHASGQNRRRSYMTDIAMFFLGMSPIRVPRDGAIGVFHALAISRGSSLLKSHWLGDFADFYGITGADGPSNGDLQMI